MQISNRVQGISDPEHTGPSMNGFIVGIYTPYETSSEDHFRVSGACLYSLGHAEIRHTRQYTCTKHRECNHATTGYIHLDRRTELGIR